MRPDGGTASRNAIGQPRLPVIFSTHILAEVTAVCERVVIISQGRIRAVDTIENLENSIGGEKLADPQSQIEIKGADQLVVQVGKRKFFKVNF